MNRTMFPSDTQDIPDGATGEPIGIPEGLRVVYAHMSARRRRQFVAVLGLMLVGGFAELATIGSVIPFLALLSAKQASIQLSWPATMFAFVGEDFGLNSLVAAAIVFVLFAILAGGVRLQLTWLSQNFIYCLGNELALDAQRRILFQPYRFHIHRNTSTLISVIDKIEIFAFDLLLPLMQTVISGVVAAFIVVALLFIDPVTAIVAAAAFSAIYLLASAFTRRRLAENSAVVGSGFHERLKIVQESLGGIRDVIIDNSQPMYLGLFNDVNRRLGHARATTSFMAAAPRYLIESAAIVVIAVVAVIISSRRGGVAMALPLLGALALAAQRLLPLLQNVYNGWSSVAGHRSIVSQVVEFLRLPLPREGEGGASPLPLRRSITVENLSFTYSTRPNSPALTEVSFEIPAGTMLALVGETGSGKSTLSDLLMALLEPSGGQICVDGIPLGPASAPSWQKSIAHVPQAIFLADTTIARNIALSLSEEPLDLPRAMEAARKSQLHDFIETLQQGYDTVIGERGIRLSGGQRQRLGLARAIYKQTPVLVLDEATSALDEVTEAAVIDALDELRQDGRTIVIIAHRRSTIARCNMVVRLEGGRIVSTDDTVKSRAGPTKAARSDG